MPMCGSNLNCPGDVCDVMQHCRYAGNRDVSRLLRLRSSSEMWVACTACPVDTRSAYMIGQKERDIDTEMKIDSAEQTSLSVTWAEHVKEHW